jgi:phosphoribosylanthranilate isomerase
VARLVYEGANGRARTVGVFGPMDTGALSAVVEESGANIVQLHSPVDATYIERLRHRFSGKIWAVLAVRDGQLPPESGAVVRATDGVVIDTHSAHRLGGTGVAFDWTRVAPALERLRGDTPIIVAGGLRADNVAEAVRALAPNAVDVSSGVESAPGIKDHALMRAFVDALGRKAAA